MDSKQLLMESISLKNKSNNTMFQIITSLNNRNKMKRAKGKQLKIVGLFPLYLLIIRKLKDGICKHWTIFLNL